MEVTICECAHAESIHENGGQCAGCSCEQFAFGGIQQSFLPQDDKDDERFSYA